MVKKRNFLTQFVAALLMVALFASVSCGKNENDGVNPKKEAERYFERGSAYYKLGKIDKAIIEYEHAVTYDKEHKMAHYNLAVMYKEKGRYTDAISQYEEYLKYATDKGDEPVKKYVIEEISKLKEKNK